MRRIKNLHNFFICIEIIFGATLFISNGMIGAQTQVESSDSSDAATLDAIDPEVTFENFITRDEFQTQVSKLAWKKGDYTFTPYGFLWVNAAVNSGACASDSFCLYNFSPDSNDTSTSAVDARTSRVGMIVDGPGFCGDAIKMKGQVEIDFQGQINMTRNKGQIQLRRAFVELVNPQNETKLQFGQDWDTISPLAPQMLNYLPAGFAGNIGYRRAQIRFEKARTWTSDFKTLWTIGLADSFPCDLLSTSGVTANSGSWPIIEGRFAVSLGNCSRGGRPITLGVSSHVGENSYIFSPVANSFLVTSEKKYIKTWSLNFDADLPINKRIRLQGEYFTGENLSSFCGGVNQGVDLYRREGIRAQGGWLSLHTLLSDKLTNNTGYAIDKPFDDDLVGNSLAGASGSTSSRTQNSVVFTNFLYQWNKALMTGVEFGYWKTNYRRANVSTPNIVYSPMAAGENFRVDCAVQYLF